MYNLGQQYDMANPLVRPTAARDHRQITTAYYHNTLNNRLYTSLDLHMRNPRGSDDEYTERYWSHFQPVIRVSSSKKYVTHIGCSTDWTCFQASQTTRLQLLMKWERCKR